MKCVTTERKRQCSQNPTYLTWNNLTGLQVDILSLKL